MALGDGWTHYWKMEESTGDLTDSIGTADGTPQGVTQGATGFIDNGITADGSNDYINIGDNCSLGSAATWTFALKTTDAGTGTANRFIFKSAASPNRSYFIHLDAGKIGLFISSNGSTANFGVYGKEFTMTAINDGDFHRCAIVYDGSAQTFILFVDGTKIDTLTSSDSTPTSINSNTVDCNFMSQAGGNALSGSFDEVGFANVAKSDADMVTLTGSTTLTYPFTAPTVLDAQAIMMGMNF